MALFASEDYEEVAARLARSCRRAGFVVRVPRECDLACPVLQQPPVLVSGGAAD